MGGLWLIQADGREVHSGLVYTRLIASMILGTTIAAYLLHGPYYLRPESFLSYVLLVGGLSLFLPAWDHQVHNLYTISTFSNCRCLMLIKVYITWILEECNNFCSHWYQLFAAINRCLNSLDSILPIFKHYQWKTFSLRG